MKRSVLTCDYCGIEYNYGYVLDAAIGATKHVDLCGLECVIAYANRLTGTTLTRMIHNRDQWSKEAERYREQLEAMKLDSPPAEA